MRRKGKLNCFTHTGNGKWQTGRQKAASVSIYSSAGDDKEAGVRVNILCGAHPVVWSLSHTHIISAQMQSLVIAPFSMICEITHGDVRHFPRDHRHIIMLDFSLCGKMHVTQTLHLSQPDTHQLILFGQKQSENGNGSTF